MNAPDNKHPAVDSFGCSQIGKHRETNADQFVVAELKRAARVHHASDHELDDSRQFGHNQAHILLVADGVSGDAGSRRASRIVVEEVMESVLNAVPWSATFDVDAEARLRKELARTVERCNAEVREAGPMNMATTLTLAFVRWPHAFVVHAGDSRAYLLSGEDIEQLTTDHTVAQRMVDNGRLEPEEAATSRFARLLWNAVGGDSSVRPEVIVHELKEGDALLLCTDGLTSHLNDGAIRHIAASATTTQGACEKLVETVTGIGGHDDVTVAMARFAQSTHEHASADEPDSAKDTGAKHRMPKEPQIVKLRRAEQRRRARA